MGVIVQYTIRQVNVLVKHTHLHRKSILQYDIHIFSIRPDDELYAGRIVIDPVPDDNG